MIDGINAHLPGDDDLVRIHLLGLKWVRIDVNWWQVEPAKGVFYWGALDKQVLTAHGLDLSIYATLAYAPGWAGKRHASVPRAEDWGAFVRAVYKRYGSRIKVYSLWNEPNLPQFFEGGPSEYIERILRPGCQALSSATTFVAAPDLATVNGNWYGWLRALSRCSEDFDIVSIHCYKDSAKEISRRFTDGKLKWLQWAVQSWRPYNRLLGRFGKPVWLTETGWDSAKTGVARQAANYASLRNLVIPGVSRVFTYELRDDPAIPQAWGVYDRYMLPKPAAKEIQG